MNIKFAPINYFERIAVTGSILAAEAAGIKPATIPTPTEVIIPIKASSKPNDKEAPAPNDEENAALSPYRTSQTKKIPSKPPAIQSQMLSSKNCT